MWFPARGRAVAQVNAIAVWAEGIKAELAQRLPRQRKTQRDKLAVLVATMLHVRSANLVEVAAGLPHASDRWDMGCSSDSQMIFTRPRARSLSLLVAITLIQHLAGRTGSRGANCCCRCPSNHVRCTRQRPGRGANSAANDPTDRTGCRVALRSAG